MTEPAEKNELIVYENVDTAPFVYFDLTPTHGILGGAIQIELAARILNAVPDGGVEIKIYHHWPAAMQSDRRVEFT